MLHKNHPNMYVQKKIQVTEKRRCMSASGLQVAMTVDAPQGCRPAVLSAENGDSIESITWSSPGDTDTATEEFEASSELDDGGVSPVFGTGSTTRYRFERDADGTCVCEIVEQADCPLTDVHAEHGQLHLTFYAPNVETVRTIVSDLREQHDGIHLQHLRQSGDPDGEALVVVDKSRLTDRQQEVLETAYQEGYFEHPKEANASELADQLDISLSTFTEHLAVAQSKLLDSLVGDAAR